MKRVPRMLRDVVRYYRNQNFERWYDIGPMTLLDALENLGYGKAAREFTDIELQAIASLVNESFSGDKYYTEEEN